MEKTIIFKGKYKGVYYEIHQRDVLEDDYFKDKLPSGRWTYYLFINLSRIPKKYKPTSFWIKLRSSIHGSPIKKKIHYITKYFKWRKWMAKYKKSALTYYDSYKHPIIGEIEFHSGITWYSKEHGFDGSDKIIKIGCDYQHIWDNGKFYSEELILKDVENSIDSFLLLIPDYKK